MRVLIIDVSHMFYKYAYGGATQLSTTIFIGGKPKIVNTTLPAYVIKQIHRWSKGGVYPTIVCYDSLGSNKSRKAYFAVGSSTSSTESSNYKGDRGNQSSEFYEGINLTFSLMVNGGMTCLKCDGYEADDLIKAAINKVKVDYPDAYIDVVTGDQDLVPLVDDKVSVFLMSRKLTYAESPDLEKLHYVQLRPHNLQSYMEDLTDFRKLKIPYNVVLLKKLLRGKKADSIPPYPKFTPTKFNNLIDYMIADKVDLATVFRYGDNIVENGVIKDPVELQNICDVLSKYLDEDIINHVKYIYRGINLNTGFTGLGMFDRKPARMISEIKSYSHDGLQRVLDEYKTNIHLPVV